jgi:O-antigen/teichoic acid export membrane protein
MFAYLRLHFASLASVMIRGLSVLAGFVVTFFIGRLFGPLATGQYALVTQTGMFLSIVAVGGMDMAVVRRFSATMVRNVRISRASMLKAVGYSIGAGLLIVAVMAVGGHPLFARLFGSDLPAHAVTLTCLVLMARATLRVTAAVLRSQNAHIFAQSFEVLVIPTMVALLLALHVLGSLQAILWATALTGLAAAAVALFRAFRYTDVHPDALQVPMKDMFRTSLPLWLTGIALNIADWYGLATAASVLGVYEAGLFRIAFQIAGALSFVAMGLYNVFTARISAALEAGDIYHVARLSRAATRLGLLITLPPVVLVLLFAHPMLQFIGPEFAHSAPLLRLMLIGQAIYVATGPAGLVLAMTGHERLNFLISASVTGGLLFVAPLATYMFGLPGLAVSMAAVPVIGNLANFFTVLRLERINIITGVYREPDEVEAPGMKPEAL